ncbi:hypothetical protein D3C73_1557080 [compost metagenome]
MLHHHEEPHGVYHFAAGCFRCQIDDHLDTYEKKVLCFELLPACSLEGLEIEVLGEAAPIVPPRIL